MRKILLLTFLSFVAVLAVSCQAKPGSDVFQLIILDTGWEDLGWAYSGEETQPILLDLDTSDNLFVVDLEDIEHYDWDRQSIRLTGDATRALLKALENATHGEEQSLMVMYEQLGWGNPIEWALFTKAFVVSVDGEPLYGGIFLDSAGEAAVEYPVIHVLMIEEAAEFVLLPLQMAFVRYDPGPSRTPQIVDGYDLPQDFFENLNHDLAASDNAQRYRRLIRDPKIKAILEASGKLR